MLNVSTIIKYPLLTMLSTGKRSFENMGRLIKKSGYTVSRLLRSASISFHCSKDLCLSMFQEKKKLFIIIDDTLIKKIHSQMMQGEGIFYYSKIGKQIIAYSLVIGIISDGKISIPIDCAYLFSAEVRMHSNRVVEFDNEKYFS
jgi:hypothetical protein